MKTTLLSILVLLSLASQAQTLEKDSVYATVYTLVSIGVPLRTKPDPNTPELSRCKDLEHVQLLEYIGHTKYKYFKVAYKDLVGYLYRDFLASDSTAVRIVNDYNKINGIAEHFDYVVANPWEAAGGFSPGNSSIPTEGHSSEPTHTIQTGPRGGKYYINAHGKKTYVKKH